MAIMSSFNFFLMTIVVILLNENLFCNGEPGLYINKEPKRFKRYTPIYGHQQPGSYQVPVTSGVQPLTYHGNYQPIANTVQQPMAYQLQPIQQRYYGQPAATTNFLLPAVAASQPAVRYVQPQQQQQVQYNQPKTIQPSTSGLTKPLKLQKPISKDQNGPTAQIVSSNAQPVKYTIPTAPVYQQTPSQAYYSAPTASYSQVYSVPQTDFTTYSQRFTTQEVPYPQGYSIPETTYPQGYSVPETSFPQGYPISETSYPQGYPVSETSYPQGYTTLEASYPQGISVPETSYPRGISVPETSYRQGYPASEILYPQGYSISYSGPQVVPGPNYIESSPKYLAQNNFPTTYPKGNPNVKIYPKKNLYTPEVFKLPEKIYTPLGEIDVELIDVMPYKPDTETIRNMPRVHSIEAVVKPQKVSKEEIDENNSIETTSRSSYSIFG